MNSAAGLAFLRENSRLTIRVNTERGVLLQTYKHRYPGGSPALYGNACFLSGGLFGLIPADAVSAQIFSDSRAGARTPDASRVFHCYSLCPFLPRLCEGDTE